MRYAAALMVLACGCASVRPNNTFHAAYVGAATADAVSTEAVLRAEPNAQEANPLLGENPSFGKVSAFKAVGFVALRSLESWAEDKAGRPLHWWERALLWAPSSIVFTWATAHNLSLISGR